MMDLLADFWQDILSSQPERILCAFQELSADQQQAVITHLQKMMTEKGWHAAQVNSATIAMNTIQDLSG
jgi:hypothetical protein